MEFLQRALVNFLRSKPFVDLNQVILNITGGTGVGNLLGNLLCGITGILDGVGIGAQLAQLLNQLLGILG